MTSSIMASMVGAALTVLVLALTGTISDTGSINLPSALSGRGNETGIDVPLHLLKPEKFSDIEQLMRTPVPFASNAQDTNMNSSAKIRSGESLGEGVKVPPLAHDFDWVEFSPEGIEEQQLVKAYHHRARSLTKLKELQCTAEEYPLVTIIDGTYVQIMSPNYPNVYPNNFRCGWKILTDPDRVIRVLCPVFQLHQGDFTFVKDYVNTTNLRFDASSPMKNVTTVSNKMFIGFKSDSEGEERWSGFMCLARSLARPQPTESASPVEKVTDAAELEVPDFRKRFGQPFTDEASETTTKDIVEQPTISSVSELRVTAVPALSLMSTLASSSDWLSSSSATTGQVTVVPALSSKSTLSSSNDWHSSFSATTGQVTAVPALSSESSLSSSSRGPSLPSVITGEYLLGLKKKAEETGTKPTSVLINRPYAQVDQIKTYTVRRGSNTYETDFKE